MLNPVDLGVVAYLVLVLLIGALVSRKAANSFNATRSLIRAECFP
ncbi:MAG: hypothetical protein NVV62_12215 [Terricaulis sp.]|nr:hypothetical protein [Terricaulis sp.]